MYSFKNDVGYLQITYLVRLSGIVAADADGGTDCSMHFCSLCFHLKLFLRRDLVYRFGPQKPFAAVLPVNKDIKITRQTVQMFAWGVVKAVKALN